VPYICAWVCAQASEAVPSYYIVEFDIPYMARLLEAIQGPQQLAYAMGPIFKAFRLPHIHFLIQYPI